jgi:predicted phosphodiesterase
MSEPASRESEQLLHLVLGGELTNIDSMEFRDVSAIDIVGVFPNYDSAERAWRAKAQATVDSAQTRYFIVHLHRMLAPTGLARKAG